MSIADRITFDTAELTQLLEAELDKLNIFRYDARYRTLLGNRLIEKLNHWDSTVRRQKDAPLTLVVCGEFKRGKSSLINALLGEQVVTTNVTTETITTNRISYGVHENVLLLPGGKRMQLSDEELAHDKLRQILAELPEKSTRLEIKRPLEILKKLTIIDTPGLGDSMQDFAEDVAAALQQADAVMYVFSVAYPLSVQEQLFIKTVIKPQKYTELYLIGNAADTLETQEDCERLGAAAASRIAEILPNEQPLLLSALDERCRQLEKRRPNADTADYLAENFAKLRAALDTLLEDKRDTVVPDRIERLIRSMFDDISSDLEALTDGLAMDTHGAQQRLQELEAEKESVAADREEAVQRIDRIAEELRGDAVSALEEFLVRMEQDSAGLGKYPAEDIKRYYSMFCVDTLQIAISKCNDYFQLSLYDELDAIAAGVSKKLSLNESSTKPKFRMALDNHTWTGMDSAAFAVSYVSRIVPVVSLFTNAVNFAAGSAHQKKIQNSTDDLIKEIQKQYPALKSSAMQALSQAYANLSGKAKQQITEYFNQQIQETQAQSEQSEMVARQDAESKEAVRAAIAEIRAVMDSINEQFVSMRNAEAFAQEG